MLVTLDSNFFHENLLEKTKYKKIENLDVQEGLKRGENWILSSVLWGWTLTFLGYFWTLSFSGKSAAEYAGNSETQDIN